MIFIIINKLILGAALGDLQCSVLSTLRNEDDSVLNISTSAQMAFISPSFDPLNFDGNIAYFFVK